jgi:hypothetical protein
VVDDEDAGAVWSISLAMASLKAPTSCALFSSPPMRARANVSMMTRTGVSGISARICAELLPPGLLAQVHGRADDVERAEASPYFFCSARARAFRPPMPS